MRKGSCDRAARAPRAETLTAFDENELRARVFYDKYSLRDPDGQPTGRIPQEMWDGVARGLAELEVKPEQHAHWQQEFRWLLDAFRFLPGGRILHAVGQAGVGRKAVPQTASSPFEDESFPSIYHRANEMAITCSRRRGMDISTLRPCGAIVRHAAHKITGAASFMETFRLVVPPAAKG